MEKPCKTERLPSHRQSDGSLPAEDIPLENWDLLLAMIPLILFVGDRKNCLSNAFLVGVVHFNCIYVRFLWDVGVSSACSAVDETAMEMPETHLMCISFRMYIF